MDYCRIILGLFFCSLVGTLSAQQVSLSEAQSRAWGFLHNQESRRSAAYRGAKGVADLQLVYTRERMTDAKPLYYVFDQEGDNGFVIIGGDEKAREVLFYCDHGHFDAEELPANFSWWLEQLEGDISRAIDLDEATPMQTTRPRAKERAATRHARKRGGDPIWD